MNPEQVKAAIEALKNNDSAAALQILEAMIIAEVSDDPGDAPAPAAMSDAAPEGADPKPQPLSALAKSMGFKTDAEAAEHFKVLNARVSAHDTAHAEVELSARRDLIAQLIRLGVETPALAWEGKPEDRKPCKRLAGEPIAELRARVEVLSKHAPRFPDPPDSGEEIDVKALSKAELAACKKANMDPAEYAARKASAVRRSS